MGAVALAGFRAAHALEWIISASAEVAQEIDFTIAFPSVLDDIKC